MSDTVSWCKACWWYGKPIDCPADFDIDTLKCRNFRKDDWMLLSEEEREIAMLNFTILSQREYIAELEQQVNDLQEALDAVLLNKCRTRKVKVKVYGRTQNVRKNHYR